MLDINFYCPVKRFKGKKLIDQKKYWKMRNTKNESLGYNENCWTSWKYKNSDYTHKNCIKQPVPPWNWLPYQPELFSSQICSWAFNLLLSLESSNTPNECIQCIYVSVPLRDTIAHHKTSSKLFIASIMSSNVKHVKKTFFIRN